MAEDNVHSAVKEMLKLVKECPDLLSTLTRDKAAGLVLRMMALDLKTGGEIFSIAMKTLGQDFIEDMKKEAKEMGIGFNVLEVDKEQFEAFKDQDTDTIN